MLSNESIKSYLTEHNLTEQPVALACSAGVDSMALFNMLITVYPKHLIYCFHLDHGLRDDSHLATEFLQQFCDEHQIKFQSQTLRLKGISSDEKTARDFRYQFFERECLKYNIKDIFLAHNLNDQAETVLFRVFRGTSSAGLQGIAMQRSLAAITIHRPLLKISRKSIVEYCRTNKLTFVEDSSNNNVEYARNRIRHNIIPEAMIINGNTLENIEKLSNIIGEEQKFFDVYTKQKLAELGDLPWNLERFRTLERIIQRKLLEQCFTSNIDFVNNFLAAIIAGGFHRINFAKNKFFTIKQKEIHLETASNC